MKIISHRGNLNGPDPENENTLKSIFLALEKGFDIEIDTWVIDNLIYFGHDKPTTIIEEKIISQIGNNGWFHCKNLEALTLLSKFDNNINYFYHNQDDFTLTNKNYIWTYPEKPISERSIMVNLDVPKLTNYKILPAGICSDYMYWNK
jgi:hypothetical protein